MATPRVVAMEVGGQKVGRYGKLELTFQLDRTFPPDSFLPYYFFDPLDARGCEGISIDTHFCAPSGETLAAPAFYFVEHRRRRRWRGRAQIEPTGKTVWKVRFAPREVGTYEFYLTVQDCHGVTRYPERGGLTFWSVPSKSKGFVRVSPRDARWLEWEDGSGFLPIGAAQQWWNTRKGLRSYQYERAFEIFRAHGINFTRVWDQCDGWALTAEGPFDAYDGFGSPNGDPEQYGEVEGRAARIAGLARGTQMNQRSNFEEDLILDAAARNGVYVELCAVNSPKWIWETSPHDTRGKAIDWNDRRVPFDEAAHLNAWKRNFRYRVARWGYSTAVLAWETWNEHDAVAADSDIYRFYEQYGAYQRATDLYGHLRTTSQGSQTWSAELWAADAFDISNYHDYMMPQRYDDEMAHDAALFVYSLAQRLRLDAANANGTVKPILWSELDTGTTVWNEPNPQPAATHAFLWAGLFSPLGMAPVDWYWDYQPYLAEKYRHAKIAAGFFSGVDGIGAQFCYLSTADVRVTSELVAVSHADLRVLALYAKDGRSAYAWVQHRATRRYDAPTEGAPLNAAFTLAHLEPGTFRVEYWNTYNGAVTRSEAKCADGRLVVPVRELRRDVAIKILRC